MDPPCITRHIKVAKDFCRFHQALIARGDRIYVRGEDATNSMKNPPFTAHHSRLTAHHSPFTAHHSRLTAHHSPFTI